MIEREKKVGGSHKIRPSVKAEAMKYIKVDTDVKSFNDLLEKALIEYVHTRRKIPRENDNQAKLDL